jgi:hypothetical protein
MSESAAYDRYMGYDQPDEEEEAVRPVCVHVECIAPQYPVANRNFDWMVYEYGQEERGSNFGPTREAALEEFFECREIW